MLNRENILFLAIGFMSALTLISVAFMLPKVLVQDAKIQTIATEVQKSRNDINTIADFLQKATTPTK